MEKLGKAVARGFKQTIAVQALDDPRTRGHILKKIGKLVYKELRALCSDNTASVLRSPSTQQALATFEWATLISELDKHAPVFLHILRSCTITKKPRDNCDAVIGMCAAILLKHRFSEMSLVQRIISMILYAGHSGKHVCFLILSIVDMVMIKFVFLGPWALAQVKPDNVLSSYSSFVGKSWQWTWRTGQAVAACTGYHYYYHRITQSSKLLNWILLSWLIFIII